MRILCLLFLLLQPLFSQRVIKTWDFRPEYFPYQFQLIEKLGNPVVFADLDNNQQLEILTYEAHKINGTYANIQLRDLRANINFQKNYFDENVTIISNVNSLNLNSDAAKEILVPWYNSDSLFLNILSINGDSLHTITLTERQPRFRNGELVDWMPSVLFSEFYDLDSDHKKELITVLIAGHALYPRGVFVHSYPEGEFIGRSIIGAKPRTVFFDDFDFDGTQEMVIHTSAPANGADGSGLTDRVPYVLLYEFDPAPILVDSMVLGDSTFTQTQIFYTNFIGDDKKEFVTARQMDARGELAEINIINPINFEIQTHLFDFPIKSVCLYSAPDEHYSKLLAVDTTNTLLLIDNQFNVEKPVTWPESIGEIREGPDIDNDGYPEIIIYGKLHNVLINHHFDIIGIWPQGELYDRYIDKFPGESRPVLATRQGSEVHVYRTRHSMYFWMYRYGFTILGFLFVFMVFIILVFGVKEHHQHKTITRYIEHIIESDSRAIAIVDKDFNVFNCNQQLLDWFGKNRNIKRPSFAEWFQEYPQLVSTLRDWHAGYSDIRRDKSITLDTSLGLRTLRLTFEPVPKPLFTKRVYQITLNDESIHAELQKAKSWTRLAQRVAHDIKNPLGTILLILQKIRNLSEKKGADYADAVSPHINKIEDRIESLRVMTRNFMKYINIETPHFALINLNEFLNGTLETVSKSLPPDITLQPQIPELITAVEIDTEQIASVIENLISNAIDALPKGGSITVSSRLAHRLQFPGYDDRPRDYALIEIRDTGLGIPPEVVERLFEPNFSYSKESSGLGLAMSKKIIEDHHGFIEVESDVDAGTLFTIYLPAKSVL